MLPALGALATRAAAANAVATSLGSGRSYHKKVGVLMFFLILLLAAFFDFLQFLITFIPIPGIVVVNIGIAAFGSLLLGGWFGALGVDFFGGKNAFAKIAVALGVPVLELVPFIDAMPWLTMGVVITFFISRSEDRAKAKEEAAQRAQFAQQQGAIAQAQEEAQQQAA